MIPITCPQCGRRGTIPSERINTRMHCKKCDAVFHMTKGGKVLLGEPGAAKPQKGGGPGGKAAPAKAKPNKRRDESSPSSIGEFLSVIPNWAKGLIVAVALLLIAWQFGLFAFLMPSDNPERRYTKDLDSRIIYVGHAFADNRGGDIRNLATPDSKDAVDEWMSKTRAAFKFEAPEKPGNRCEIQAAKLGDETAGRMDVGIHIIPPLPYTGPEVEQLKEIEKKTRTGKPPMVLGYDRGGLFDLPTSWVKTGNEWRLDVKKSLEHTKTTYPEKK